MTYPKVYLIIVNYNIWSDIVECLKSVLKNDYPNHQVEIIPKNWTG